MEKRYGRIVGWGAYAPSNIITNHDLSKTLDTDHEWIVQRTGIHERRVVSENETTATMAVAAAEKALRQANMTGNDLDLIIVATSSPDYLTPPVSSQVQHMLGAEDVPAFVLVTGCTGFLYALTVAQQFISAGSYKNILIIGAELLSRFIDWSDRSMCVLFGDAAGAFIMQASSEPCGISGFEMGSDGSGFEHIIARAAGAAEPINENTFADGRQYIQMNGREVFKFATRVIGRSTRRVLSDLDMTFDDIDWIVPHQANYRIIKAAAREMKRPLDNFLINIDRYANTSAASIPLVLCEALDSGKVKPEDKLLMVSFGAGLTWATMVIQMAPSPVVKVGALNGRVGETAVSPTT